MKFNILIFTAIFLSLGAIQVVANEENTDVHTKCKYFGNLAEKVMQARQQGIPLSTVLEIFEGDAEKNIIINAYKKTQWQTETSQSREIKSYRNEVELICYEAH